MKYIGVIQATYYSPEFQGKVLAHVDHDSVLALLIKRLKTEAALSSIVIATTVESYDDPVALCAEKNGVSVYRGEVSDLIGRIYHAVEKEKPDGICLFFGNAPLVDCKDLNVLIKEHHAGSYDFSYNEHHQGVIYGMGTLIYSFSVLTKLMNDPRVTVQHRGVGSFYILQNPDEYTIYQRRTAFNRPQYKVLVDEERDLKVIKTILKYVPDISNESVGRFLDDNPIVTEHMNRPSVSETGIEKLLLFPEKIRQYQTAECDDTYPVVVELSLTNRCNLRCEWCSDKKLRDSLGGELDGAILGQLLNDLKRGGTRSIVIEGGGEPTLHAQFSEIVRTISRCGFYVGLITNGTYDLSADLLSLFSWVRFSLDSADSEQYLKFKKADLFHSVMKNIEFCAQHKKDTIVGVGYVVTKYNIHLLERLVLQLKQYGIDYIQFRPVIDAPHLTSSIDLSYLRKYESGKFRVDIEAMDANAQHGNAGVPCKAHSLSTVITADGGVYLCGRLNIYDWCKPIGNINTSSFRDMWLGEERRSQARQVLDPSFCLKYCPQCRMTKYNQQIDKIMKMKTKGFI
jgi:MoaA/NifB/PqqE/SkfB family radical SAM enzyme/spore coat polysaccharide biosynthesis protein SpsF (cytidylyltransferase family)